LALGVLVLGYGPWEAYTLLLPFSPGTLIHLLVPISPQTQGGLGDLDSLIAVLTAAGFYLLCVFPMLVKGLYSLVRPGPAASRPRASERGRQLRPSVIRFLALVAAVAGLALVPNQDRRNLIESDYLAYHGRWTELLHRAHRYSNDPLVLSSVNRALFHTGALADRMFEFPQTGGDVLLLGRDSQTPFDEGLESRAPRVWRRAELHMDLGLLEAAKTELVLLTDWIGPRPLVLRKLALIALSTGDLGAARIVLGELSKSLFDAGWAAEKLARLDNGDDLAADPEIRELRRRTRPTDGDSLLFEEDVFDTYLDDAKALERVHNENPNNRMAAEYLLAMRLLGRQLDAFVEELADNPELSGRPLPAHYQEAIVLYRESKEGQERTAQYVVDPRVVDRWTAYKSRSGNRTAADKTTYWSYYDAAAQTGAAQ
jgi:phage FluMu protein gp41